MTQPVKRPVVLAISGSDSSGAAGMQADLKTLQALQVQGASVITAATAQTWDQAFAANILSSEMIESQLDAALKLEPAAIKIGMTGNADTTQLIARKLHKITSSHQPPAIILDPVLKTSSGMPLADAKTRSILINEIIPITTLVTPNLDEASLLASELARQGTNVPVTDATFVDVRRAACALLDLGAKAVLIKGGHTRHDNQQHVKDYFADTEGEYWIASPRHPCQVRGTGCSLASAVAAGLALGDDLKDALIRARSYIARAIRLADGPLLQHAAWPVTAEDFPWVELAASKSTIKYPAEPFADCGPAPLGFYPVVDRTAWIERLAPLGVTTVQLRIKDLAGRDLADEIASAIAFCRRHGIRLFVNDYWRLAISHEAYGVHLGQEDLLDADLDAIQQAGLRLGVSTHSLFEAAIAKAVRPSYIALGPIFPTTCKSMRFGPQGFARLREWRHLWSGPLVAIGGLKVEHISELRTSGVNGVAVISDVTHASSPEGRASAWVQGLAGKRS